MTPPRMTALVVAAFMAMPASALAAHHSRQHRVHTSASLPTVTVVVPHKYDAGGDGAGQLVITNSTRINLIDVLSVAQGLGNNVLGQLGLPPIQLPTV